MKLALWIAQAVLALAFLGAGSLKLAKTPRQLGETIPILGSYSNPTLKAIGLLEVLGAIGLIAPPLTGIARFLTPLAAVGLALTMVGAAIAHGRRGEMSDIGKNGVLFALAVFVAWGRWGWI